MPPGLAFDASMIDAEHEPRMYCEDIGAFLEGVGAFSIIYDTAGGSFMMDLCAAMVAKGLVVDAVPLINVRTRLHYNLPSAQIFDFFKCPCGCCNKCNTHRCKVEAVEGRPGAQ